MFTQDELDTLGLKVKLTQTVLSSGPHEPTEGVVARVDRLWKWCLSDNYPLIETSGDVAADETARNVQFLRSVADAMEMAMEVSS